MVLNNLIFEDNVTEHGPLVVLPGTLWSKEEAYRAWIMPGM